MTQQPSTSRAPVALWGLVLVLSLAVFAGAFWYLDGTSVVSGLFSQVMALIQPSDPSSSSARPAASIEPTLTLPAGMPEEFALRLWQEQLDSQATIRKLVDGQIVALTVKSVDVVGDEARLDSVVSFSDGTSASGVIGMRRFADNWYVAYADAGRGDAAAPGPGSAPLPAIETVDVRLLNTILAQQVKSKDNLQEYVDGKVKKVTITGVKAGPNTATIKLDMDEDHEEAYADLVAIKQKVGSEDAWFLARFVKTGTSPDK